MGITLDVRVCSISSEPNKLHSNVPLSDLVYITHDSAMQTQSQGHTSRSWDSAAGDAAVFQTALLFNFE